MKRRLDVERLGQVFTPPAVVKLMLGLRQCRGRILEPSCGDGAFSRHLPGCVAIELDRRVAPDYAICGDFFAYPTSERFSTVLGNPPYVKYQDISIETRRLLDGSLFDGRSNLALFFIEKAVRHLQPHGELIFIVPREFIKLTAARKLNRWLYENGTITHWIETGDTRLFDGAVPNCAIFRYELGNFTRQTQFREWHGDWQTRDFVEMDGQLTFPREHLSVPLASLFEVKVGAVSGADGVFEHPEGNVEFVCSKTIDTGQTRRMLYNVKHDALQPYRAQLLQRRVRKFDDANWWMWGRAFHDAPGRPRIYVNGRTRRAAPFFTHPCEAYDGSILALFPKVEGMDLAYAINLLNSAVPWPDLGFVVDGRFVFSQRSLQTLLLPESFNALRRPRAVLHEGQGAAARIRKRA
ncbi:class I SAM-dependent methyltransferase [Niveibacterium sp. 24ML]|uniref:class I SAM-dependent methyltransferase n=1 Tax=Niveibacterium sp. 24ML TaxID=2985512 RepID=UPI002B4BB65D|nr:class I SAM-dependent methyltransferase [Niveibacterium sp. 24ML]